jgi:hypothetical protein
MNITNIKTRRARRIKPKNPIKPDEYERGRELL